MLNKEVTEQKFAQFSEFLYRQTGIVLGENKSYLVRSRLSTLMLQFNVDDINVLISKIIASDSSEITHAAIDVMTTNETLWFRDNYPFDILKRIVLPDLSNINRPIKIWSAACSSGQEPYSIAMTFNEYCDQIHSQTTNIEIVASDLSTSMIEKCKAGLYDELSLSRGAMTRAREKKNKRRTKTQKITKKLTIREPSHAKSAANTSELPMRRAQYLTPERFLRRHSFAQPGQCFYCAKLLRYLDQNVRKTIVLVDSSTP